MVVEKELIYYVKQLNVYAGINILLPRYFRTLPPRLYRIWEGYAFVLELLLVCVLISLIMPIILSQDIEIALMSLGGISLIVSTMAKGVIFQWFCKPYTKIVNEIEVIYNRNNNNPFDDDKFDEFYEENYNWLLKYTKMIWQSQAPFPFLWGFVHTAYSIYEADNTKWIHPVKVWGPYEHENQSLLRYHIEIWYMTFGYVAFNVRNIVYDALFSSTFILIISQMKYLNYLGDRVFEEDGKPDDPAVVERLHWWSQQHSEICRALEEFRCITSPYMITTYSVVLFDIFVVAIVVTLMDTWDPFQKGIVGTMVVVQLLQLYFISVIGDMLQEVGLSLTDECWLNTFIIQNKRVKSSFSYMLSRARKCMTITAGGLYPLSSATFSSLCSATFSTYITIMQVRNKNLEEAAKAMEVVDEINEEYEYKLSNETRYYFNFNF